MGIKLKETFKTRKNTNTRHLAARMEKRRKGQTVFPNIHRRQIKNYKFNRNILDMLPI